MTAAAVHDWAYFEAKRRLVREFFIAQLSCDPQELDCELVDLGQRTDDDIVADALALGMLISEIAKRLQEPIDLIRFVPGYVEDSRFRQRIDCLIEEYLGASLKDKCEKGLCLMTYCMRNGGATTITLPPTSVVNDNQVNLVCEAVAILGGLPMASVTLGVSIQTLQSWVTGEPVRLPEKLKLLFQLAGIEHNPDRHGVRFLSSDEVRNRSTGNDHGASKYRI
jgi:hypothetical protein